MGFHGGLMGFYGGLMGFCGIYSLGNIYITIERSTIPNRKTDYFYGHFQEELLIYQRVLGNTANANSKWADSLTFPWICCDAFTPFSRHPVQKDVLFRNLKLPFMSMMLCLIHVYVLMGHLWHQTVAFDASMISKPSFDRCLDHISLISYTIYITHVRYIDDTIR